MKQRLFKKDEAVPKYIINYIPIEGFEPICKFGVDVELVINKRGYNIYPMKELQKGEVLIFIHNINMQENLTKKKLHMSTKPRKAIKKRYIRKSYEEAGFVVG